MVTSVRVCKVKAQQMWRALARVGGFLWGLLQICTNTNNDSPLYLCGPLFGLSHLSLFPIFLTTPNPTAGEKTGLV